MEIHTAAEGKVAEMTNNECVAVLQTELGKVYVDINTDFPLRLEIGDNIEISGAKFYINNGIIFYSLDIDTELFVNGWRIKFTETAK